MKNRSPKNHNNEFEEVSSRKWEVVNLSEQEEDLVYRMHKLIGNRIKLTMLTNKDHRVD
ncbi:hypothetical protein HanOQP8_Chr17g0674891 [Helianthus annuus]|nr:hypothetical protein HanHA89_Chr17g0721601 [Helianthus annuus]KAJ0633713.1 hypothetical protein HanLR1_Chr17g0680031 [Helianthus annuus]KAJ0637522.1 hypothetical protein HanOQP8_Chr17g0674891 [Helianthus annuus]